MVRAWAIVLAAGVGASCAWGDEILFKNGDRLTGVIKSADGGKLVIESKVAGAVTVSLEEVATFTTEAPIEVHLADGTVLKQPIARSEQAGAVSTAPGGAVQAQDIPLNTVARINPPLVVPTPVKWAGSVSAGVMVTEGNSETQSANVDFEAIRRTEEDRITLEGRYYYSRETVDDVERTSADNWRLAGKYDYFITERFYTYANTKIERDRIANLDLRLTPGVGLGYQWFETPESTFNTEGGLTWVYERYTDPDETRKFIAARVAYRYTRELNENVSFFHSLEVLPSLEDIGEFILTTDAGIRAKLSKDFFGELKVVLDHNSDPAPGRDKNDVKYMASVGWQF